ncbi:hypothetical protein OIO90_004539 [Microbotryomycetes sp. JL221]|nr:hypothetical protein OIO90_004539 [Microbotryomycetes sp. JL221]
MATATTTKLIDQPHSLTGSEFIMINPPQAGSDHDSASPVQPSSACAAPDQGTDEAPQQVSVLNTGATGLCDTAKETLDAMNSAPELPPGAGIEAAVGKAKGERPEVTVETRNRSDTNDSKMSWLKKLSGTRSRSNSPKTESREGDDNDDGDKQDEVDALHLNVVASPTSDLTGEGPLSTEPPASAQADNNSSMGYSIREDVASEYDVDPAVSDRRFHRFFTSIPAEEELIETYLCALVREIALAGRLYISEHHVGFRTNILGFSTSVSIPFSEITTIEKRSTAKVIPNAIEIVTHNSRHLFSNLLKRDSCYNLLVAVWRHEHPEEQRVREKHERGASDMSTSSESEDQNPEARSQVSFEDDRGTKKNHIFRDVFNGKLLRSMTKKDGSGQGKTAAERVKEQALQEGDLGHDPTSYDGDEYSHEVADFDLPTSPLKAYNLLFKDEEFLRPFLETKEGLKELNLGQWHEQDGKKLQTREMDYIKPLNSSIGPKQTHCFVEDDEELVEPEQAIVDVTTTKTPDVPSGHDFSTMTKTVFTWSQTGGTRVHVTSDVEWTKVNRMLKGIIERSCIEGQKKYHADLEAAAREHITAHKNDFADEGVTQVADVGSQTKRQASASSVPASVEAFIEKISQPSPALLLAVVVALLILSNIWTLIALRQQAHVARRMRLGHPTEVAHAVSRVLDGFHAVYERSTHDASGGHTLAHLRQELKSIVESVGRIEHSMTKLVDRLKGLQDSL